jgi:hypothetical protein
MDADPETLKLRGRIRYETLVAAVAIAVDEADPIGLLATGCPADEYSAEIGTIVPRVSKALDPAEVRRIVHEEFVRWFDAGTAGPEDAYESLAKRLWEAVGNTGLANMPLHLTAPGRAHARPSRSVVSSTRVCRR